MFVYVIGPYLVLILVFALMLYRCKRCMYRERTFQQLIDHINVGYYKYRARDGVVLAANRGFTTILELDMDMKEVVGKSLSELLIYVDDNLSIREMVREKGQLKDFKYHFKTLEGKDKYILHNSYLINDPFTKEEVVVALIEDITEEKKSYEKMRESQERYQKLIKSSGDMVFVFDIDEMVIEEVNPIAEVITDFSEKELVGKSFPELIHPARRKDLRISKSDLLFSGGSTLETVMVSKKGIYKEVILTMNVVELGERDIILAVVKDISSIMKERGEERKRKQELEDFWKASVEREERIKELREELESAKHKIISLEGKNGKKRPGKTE